MKSRLACILLVAFLPFVGLAVARGLRAQDDAVSSEQKLQTLLVERRDILSARLKAFESMHEVGLGDLHDVVLARLDVLNAELELAATKAERIEVLKKRVQHFRKLEDWAKATQSALVPQPRPGRRAAPVDMLLATAARLQAEVDLVRAEMAEE